MSDDRFADYRRGVESGTMKSATPNVVRDLLDEIERLQRLIVHDKDGAVVTQAAFNAAVCQIEQFKNQIQSWKDGHAVQEQRHADEIEQLRALTSDRVSGEEVERYRALDLTDRLKDRGALMKRVPAIVVDTIIAAEVKIDSLKTELDECRQNLLREGMERDEARRAARELKPVIKTENAGSVEYHNYVCKKWPWLEERP